MLNDEVIFVVPSYIDMDIDIDKFNSMGLGSIAFDSDESDARREPVVIVCH